MSLDRYQRALLTYSKSNIEAMDLVEDPARASKRKRSSSSPPSSPPRARPSEAEAMNGTLALPAAATRQMHAYGGPVAAMVVGVVVVVVVHSIAQAQTEESCLPTRTCRIESNRISLERDRGAALPTAHTSGEGGPCP